MWFQSGRTRKSALCAGAFTFAVCILAFGQSKAPNSEHEVMAHLNLVLRWAQQWQGADLYLTRAGDQLYVDNGRDLAAQVKKLEFQSALAQASLIGESSSNQTSASSGASGNSASVQNIFRAKQNIDRQVQSLQAQLDAVNKQIPAARAKDRPALMSQRDTLQGQLQLAQALLDNLQKLTSFMTSAENASVGAGALTGKILALERSNPDAVAAQPAKSGAKSTGAATKSATTPGSRNSENPGLVGQLGQLVHLVETTRSLQGLKDGGSQLEDATRQYRAPLIAALRATLQQGQIEIANSSASATGQPATANQAQATPAAKPATPPAAASAPATTPVTAQTAAQKQRAMTELVRHFKLLSAATLPLSQELILIDQSQANLTQLQDSIQHDYVSILRSLLVRAGTILIGLFLIWLFSELWRRATFRYIHDARRRRQFLALRRVVTGFCMFVVVILGFISDFSSLATYAGLITAGIAVALQAVILSIAAYFFLVGRYGVKVGDRITVNNVAGDVVDIGLIRFYMMELAGTGIDMQPTGRICVLPNSVLFQTNPLYKQLPGMEYVWREIALPMAPDSDGALAEKELLAAVNRLYSGYGSALERQHASMETTLGMRMDVPKPYTRVRFVGAGLEVIVRYPVPLRKAGDLDDHMVQEVADLLRKNPSIKLASGAAPDLRSPVKV